MAGLRRGRRQLDLLRARPARDLDLRRDGRARSPRPRSLRRRRRRAGRPTSSASPPRWPRASSRPTAPAARSSGCTAAGPPTPASSAAELVGTASPARRPCWRAGSASSRPGCTATATSTRSPTGSGTTWAVPGIFFKPYPANHFTHAAIDAAAALRERGVTPGRRRAPRRSACPRPTCARSASRSRSSARPRPATWPSSAGRTPSRSACSAAAGSAPALEDYTDELADDPRAGPDGARSTWSPTSECTAIFPHQFPAVLTAQLHDGRDARRGGAHHPRRAPSARCRSRSCPRSSATTPGACCSPARRRGARSAPAATWPSCTDLDAAARAARPRSTRRPDHDPTAHRPRRVSRHARATTCSSPNAQVVRPGDDAPRAARRRHHATARSPPSRSRIDPAAATEVARRRRQAPVPRRRRRAPALGHLQRARRGRRHREPGGRAGRRHLRASPTSAPAPTT